MNDSNSKSAVVDISCKRGCKARVPQELEAESICVLHFILGIDSACSGMRREAAMELATMARRREIESYVKTTALKLSDVATSNTRLSDDLKKRVLTHFSHLDELAGKPRPLEQPARASRGRRKGWSVACAHGCARAS